MKNPPQTLYAIEDSAVGLAAEPRAAFRSPR
jgi:hypothetical protein